MTSSTARLPSELWNAAAEPWNSPLTPSGSVLVRDSPDAAEHVAERRRQAASPNEIVTAGSWPL